MRPNANPSLQLAATSSTTAASGLHQRTVRELLGLQPTGTSTQRTYDDRLTRGGPQARLPVGGNVNGSFFSDTRKSWSVQPGYSYSWNAEGGRGQGPNLFISVRPSPSLRIGFEPNYFHTHALAQYVTTRPDPDATSTYGSRYVFATLDQRSVLVTRVDGRSRRA